MAIGSKQTLHALQNIDIDRVQSSQPDAKAGLFIEGIVPFYGLEFRLDLANGSLQLCRSFLPGLPGCCFRHSYRVYYDYMAGIPGVHHLEEQVILIDRPPCGPFRV